MALNNIGLVEFARTKIGTPYVYGCKQTRGKETKLTLNQYRQLRQLYGKHCVWDSDVSKVGQICCDCSGLISWYTGVICGSSQFKNNADKVYTIDSIKTAPVGVAVWMQGHIGIYTGLKDGVPYYIAEDGSAYGCREVPLSYNKFTHWFKIKDIVYYDSNLTTTEDDEMITNTTININGKNYTFNRILKDNKNYVELSGFKQAGFDVGYDVNSKQPSFGVSTSQKTVKINSENKQVNTIMKNNENYIRLRDLEDILNIGYENGEIIINNKK